MAALRRSPAGTRARIQAEEIEPHENRHPGTSVGSRRVLRGRERIVRALPRATAVAVELAVAVRSSRSGEAVDDLRARLDRHVTSPAAADFLDLADALLPASRRQV